MECEFRIYVSRYLDDLNEKVDYLVKWHRIKPDSINKINVKTIAANLEVSEYQVKNLTTYSRYALIRAIAGEILDAYWGFFDYDFRETEKEYPDEIIDPRDISYVIHYMCDYYNEEFLNY